MLRWEVQDAIEEYLNKMEYNYEKTCDEDDPDIINYDLNLCINSKVYAVDVRMEVTENYVSSMVCFPIKICEDRLAEVNEFITRINHDWLLLKKFILGYETHNLAIVWRHFLGKDNSFNADLAENMLYLTVSWMEELSDDILEILLAGVSGKDQYLKTRTRLVKSCEDDEEPDADSNANFDVDSDAEGGVDTEDTDFGKPMRFIIRL